jgi:hypothetical protein
MAGHLLFNSGSNESSLAPQFKWLDNTFKGLSSMSRPAPIGPPAIHLPFFAILSSLSVEGRILPFQPTRGILTRDNKLSFVVYRVK